MSWKWWGLIAALAVSACTGTARAAHCIGEPDLDLWVTGREGGETRLTDLDGAEGFAAWSPDGGQIAFVASHDGNCEVYVMDADGSQQTNLTESGVDEMYPSWSPDGSRIVYTAQGQLLVIDLSTGSSTKLTQTGLIHNFPDWSPDGETIVFSGGEDQAGPGVAHEIYVIAARGGEERALTDRGRLLVAPRWSPDGHRIAYFDHGDFTVWVMGSDGSEAAPMFPGGHLSWSPDGASIVHDRVDTSGDANIYIDGETILVARLGTDTLPAWSPDGDSILFSSTGP